MVFASVFSFAVGSLMLVQWTVTLARKRVPAQDEGVSGRGRREMAFHWAAESLTAIALILSGTALLRDWSWGRSVSLVALGMLIYTVINSSGWFAERREWAMVGVFAILLIGAGISLAFVL